MEFRRTRDVALIAKMNQPVQELHHKLYPELFVPYERSAIEAYFRDEIDNENMHFIVAFDGELPVGFICYEEIIKPESAIKRKSHKLYVHQMSVNDAFRGKGVGKQLINLVLNYAREKRIGSVELDFWARNEHACGFYKNMGFKERKENVYIEL